MQHIAHNTNDDGGPAYSYPHTIENSSGECFTFERRVPRRAGERLEVSNVVQPGAGPPMHVHYLQEESLTVKQGRMGYQRLGETEQFVGPGETVVFKSGDAHRFRNAGQDALLCTGYIEPADNIEYFLTEIFASAKRSGGARPDLFDAAFLTRRYRHEFAMLEIPAPAQRFVIPVLAAVGRLLGRYRGYSGAPEPVRR